MKRGFDFLFCYVFCMCVFRFCQSLFPTCELQFSKFRMCVFFTFCICFSFVFACLACVFRSFCMFCMCVSFVFACVFLLFLRVLHVCCVCFACVFLLFCMFCLQFDYYFSNGLRPALRIQIYDTDASNLK